MRISDWSSDVCSSDLLFLSFRIERMSASAVQTAFWAFATVMGVSMATIFMTFTGMSIGRTFLITAIMFGGVSLWGYTTKRDLARFSTFLFMGLIGVVIASLDRKSTRLNSSH